MRTTLLKTTAAMLVGMVAGAVLVPGVGPETPADHDYQGGFAAALMLKDLKLAMQAAQEADATTPMGERAAELYAAFVGEGQPPVDFSGIIRTLR